MGYQFRPQRPISGKYLQKENLKMLAHIVHQFLMDPIYIHCLYNYLQLKFYVMSNMNVFQKFFLWLANLIS